MQKAKIEKINFTNGVPNYPETSIDGDLMEQFESLLDIEKFKNILSSALEGLSNKINTFEWGIELFFIDVKDDLSNDSYIRIGCNIYQLGAYGYRPYILFYDLSEKYCEFKVYDKDLIEKGISLIFVDFFEFISSKNAYICVSMSRDFCRFENCCEELIKNKVLHFNFIDYIDQEFDFKYKKNLADWNSVNYLVGKDIRSTSGQKISSYDFKALLNCLIIYKIIPNQLSEEEIFHIFEKDDIQQIIDNLKLLLY